MHFHWSSSLPWQGVLATASWAVAVPSTGLATTPIGHKPMKLHTVAPTCAHEKVASIAAWAVVMAFLAMLKLFCLPFGVSIQSCCRKCSQYSTSEGTRNEMGLWRVLHWGPLVAIGDKTVYSCK